MAICVGASSAADYLLDMGLSLPFSGPMGETHAMRFLAELAAEWRFRNSLYEAYVAVAAARNAGVSRLLEAERLRREALDDLSRPVELDGTSDSDSSSDSDSGADSDGGSSGASLGGGGPGPDLDGVRED